MVLRLWKAQDVSCGAWYSEDFACTVRTASLIPVISSRPWPLNMNVQKILVIVSQHIAIHCLPPLIS